MCVAQDVTTFLAWAAEPELNERHRMGMKAMFLLTLAVIPSLYYKRMKWSVVKNRVIRFTK